MQTNKKLSNNGSRSWWFDSFWLILALSALFFIMLGVRPLFVPDEGRYAEIAREMVSTGDYVTPYLNGIKYFEKPALFYWLGAAAIKIGGANLWSVRSINALIGLLGCLLTYFTGRKLYDRTTGILSAILLGTSLLYFFMAHTVSLDLTVTVFISATLFSFLLGLQEQGFKRRLWMWNAATMAALAVLTKGLIGLVFPAIIIGSWIVIMNEWRLLKSLYLPSSLGIFFLIVTPWHLLVSLRNPEFFYFYFIEQHILRYTIKSVGHYQPVWFFIPCILIGFFPWITFLPQAIYQLASTSWQSRQAKTKEIFFLLWATLIFAFFSFSKSKLIPYILPIFPALSLLTARYLALNLNQKNVKAIQIGYWVQSAAAIGICIAIYYVLKTNTFANPKIATYWLSMAAIIIVSGSLLGCFYAYRNIKQAIIITSISTMLLSLALLGAMPGIDTRSILPLAKTLQPLLNENDEVITYNQYFQDLPFYLQQRVSILNWKNELRYGMEHQDTREWMLNDDSFWSRWHSTKTIYLFISLSELKEWQRRFPEEKIYLIQTTATTALASNKPSSFSS